MSARHTPSSASREQLSERIGRLKVERNAILLVHNYQLPEVQDIADFLGDSLGLSRQAAATDADTIVFCGVHFMAETAAILSPQKAVLLPVLEADCPMARMITPERLQAMKDGHPGAKVVTYVNSTAEIKAMSDYCCTSANAVKVLRAVDEDEVIFVPDRWLGSYAARFVNKKVYCHDGFCPTHHRIMPAHILRLKHDHPAAEVVVHPECPASVVELADAVESTTGICNYVRARSAEEFIIGTEVGLLYRLEKENPGKRFYAPSYVAVCPNMKMTTLETIVWALEDMEHRITVPEPIASAARASIDRMLELV